MFAVRKPAVVMAVALAGAMACSSFSSSDVPADGGGLEAGAPDAPPLADGGDGGPSAMVDASSAKYRTAVLADQPIAYWRMGTTSAATIPNELGGTNVLVIQGSVALGVNGALGGDVDTAVRFDGVTTGYLQADDARPFDFKGPAPFTVEWWAKHEPVDGGAKTQYMLGATQGSTPDSGSGYFVYWVGDTDVQVEFAQPNLVTTLTSKAPLAWTHFALIFDGTMLSLFINGSLAIEKPSTVSLAGRQSAFVVGATSDPNGIGGYGFAGKIDEVAVYAKALSPSQLSAHVAAAK